MTDFTTPEGCEPSLAAQPRARIHRTRGLLSTSALNRLAAVFGLWITVAVLYWPSAVSLNALWTSPAEEEAFSHGYLILLISLWLIVRDRRRLATAPVRPKPLALVPLLLLSALWVWSWRAAIQEAHVMLLPVILFTAVVAALGRSVARVLAFPIGYLYFAMPMWSDVNGVVQSLSAKVSGLLIWLTGMPAYLQGDYVHLPGGTIEIASTCSGLHALIVGLALATLYGKVSGERLPRRLLWIGVMGALSLAVNWVRIFTVLVAAYLTDMHSSLVQRHYWLGWWLFAAVFAGFLWWTGRQRSSSSNSSHALDVERYGKPAPPNSFFSVARLALTVAVLAALPALAYGMDWEHSRATTEVDIKPPVAPNGWNGPQSDSGGEWQPIFISPGGASLTRYTDANGRSVEVFAVAYRVQNQHAKLLSYWNHLLGGKGQLRSESQRIVDSPSGPWEETMAIDRDGTRSLIWSRYRIGNRLFVRPRLSQLWYGFEAAALNPPLSSLTALRAICTPDCKSARLLLRSATQLQPILR